MDQVFQVVGDCPGRFFRLFSTPDKWYLICSKRAFDALDTFGVFASFGVFGALEFFHSLDAFGSFGIFGVLVGACWSWRFENIQWSSSSEKKSFFE